MAPLTEPARPDPRITTSHVTTRPDLAGAFFAVV
jgi:hypothetical protein